MRYDTSFVILNRRIILCEADDGADEAKVLRNRNETRNERIKMLVALHVHGHDDNNKSD